VTCTVKAKAVFIEEHVRDGYNIGDIEAKLLRNGFSRVDARYSYGTPGKISWRLSMKWPLLMLNTSRIFFLVLPFYYLFAYPISFLLNMLDVTCDMPRHRAHCEGRGSRTARLCDLRRVNLPFLFARRYLLAKAQHQCGQRDHGDQHRR
jgi:hypothetical protein